MNPGIPNTGQTDSWSRRRAKKAARMFVDLMPDVALVCAEQADRQGNLYTGPNTEDTPTIVEATAFHDGVVVGQVNEIVDELLRGAASS